jgi:hypothetical protein
MRQNALTRALLTLALAAGVVGWPAFGAKFEPQPGPAKGNHPPVRPGTRAPVTRPNQDHLQQWMEHHQNQPLPQQLRDLESEPGFHDLPPQVQQRYRDRLIQLNSMNPQQRDRMLERNEALERLSPPERQQYRSAVQEFASMPPDRRRLMARAVIDLRMMPPDQRMAILNSDRFRGQFSNSERATLANLLAVEPYYAGPPQ